MITKAKNKKPAKAKKSAAKKPAAKKPATKAKAKPAPKPTAKPAKAAGAKSVAVKPAAKAAHKSAVKPAIRALAQRIQPKPSVKAPTPAAKPSHAAAAKHAAPAAAPAASKSAQPVAPAAPKKPSFKVGELIVYPAHGVGKITSIEEQEIAGARLELYIVDFEKEKLRLKVPTNRAEQKGMRHLADRSMIEQAMKVIRGRARIKRVMWSRRAQEYDAKINSGDMIAVAEVIRDLYRSERQPEQSYSERQLFEQALARFARELAAVRKVDDDQCVRELEEYLARNAKRAATEKANDEESADEAA
jgi:CarD family transcriptional regulator